MPVSNEMKQFYPDNWTVIRALVLSRAEMRTVTKRETHNGRKNYFFSGLPQCEFCAAPNHRDILRSAQDPSHWSPKRGDDDRVCNDRGEIVTLDFCEEFESDGDTTIVLTVAHLDQDPTNNSSRNLAALCQRCHFVWDQNHKALRQKVERELLGQESIPGTERTNG